METTRYFERTLFYDRSPAADEYYQRSSELIFEKEIASSKIEVRVQSSSDLSLYGKTKAHEAVAVEWRGKGEQEPSSKSATAFAKHDTLKPERRGGESKNAKGRTNGFKNTATSEDSGESSDDEDAWSMSSKASSTALPVALDQHQGGSCPPMYPGPPKLTVIDLDTASLHNFIRSTRHDFRVFYLRQRHSYSRLQITKSLFEQLLKLCHVFPRFNEYLIGFGLKQSESEVGPPPLKFRPLCEAHSNAYRGFECAYILRYVEFTNRPGGRNPWSLRQFAIYHRYKPKLQSRCSTWILVGASQRTEVRLDQYTRSIDDLTESNPFELHVIFLDTAIASWRPYLVHLTQQVTRQSNKAIMIMIGDEDDEDNFVSIGVEDHQGLKQIEDELADLMLCLDSTFDTVSTFMDMYEQFRNHQGYPMFPCETSKESAYGTDAVLFALKENSREISCTRKKAEALLSKVQNTRTLISSLLERQSGHNIDQQMSALQKLEKQGQDENVIMRQLAEKNSRDSSSMRILTIITMIYLPCTIVSNFYSTQFVKQSSDGTSLEYSQNAWLFFAISVPLTLATILIWYLWVNSEKLLQPFHKQGSHKKQQLGGSTRMLKLKRSFDGLPR